MSIKMRMHKQIMVVHTMEYCLEKGNTLLIHAATYVNLKIIMLRK